MTDTDIDTLRKLADAATPGPWAMVPAGNKPEVMCGARSGWGSTTICRVESLNFVEDARFIAAANPTAVIALLDELTALRAKVKAQQEALKPFAEAAKLYNREGVELAHIISVGDLCRAAQEAGNE